VTHFIAEKMIHAPGIPEWHQKERALPTIPTWICGSETV